MKTINSNSFKGKKVLIRVDFNVPLDQNQQISDNTRIVESLPTINKLLDDGAALILISHLGRPKGHESAYSLRPVAIELQKLLNRSIYFTRDLFGEKTKEVAKQLKPREVLLLENIRFYPEEEKGDEEFAKELASLADVYVNDAFGTAHRDHASTSTIAKFFPKEKYFGLLLAKELTHLDMVLNNAKRPFTAIIGGVKVSSKISIICNLIDKVDNMIIGGGMAFTFIKALGGKIGKSIYEEESLQMANEAVNQMTLKGVNFSLPTDAIIARNIANGEISVACAAENIPPDMMGLDIGPKTRKRFAEIITKSSTLLWNGPMGVFEIDNFKKGTKAIAIAVASTTIGGGYSLIGGGDTVAAVNQYNLADEVSYVSTGGGAMLEYMEGKELPGVKAIMD